MNVKIPLESAQKDTILHKIDDTLTWGPWVCPAEVDKMKEDALKVLLDESMIARLDILADEYYENTRLWWIIAVVNDLINVFDEMHDFLGMSSETIKNATTQKILLIPLPDKVRVFLRRGRNA